jgi:hypothetical protein
VPPVTTTLPPSARTRPLLSTVPVLEKTSALDTLPSIVPLFVKLKLRAGADLACALQRLACAQRRGCRLRPRRRMRLAVVGQGDRAVAQDAAAAVGAQVGEVADRLQVHRCRCW